MKVQPVGRYNDLVHTFPFELIAIFLSSAITLAVIYFELVTTQLQQIVLALVIILLLFSNRFLFFRIIFLFLLSLLIQVWILSTGGIKSPFLILFHLFALGLSFLANIKSATVFLLLSVFVLIAQTLLDPRILQLAMEDPGSTLLYLTSFLVTVPLFVLVNRFYHIKDSLLNVLHKQLKITHLQQESLLKGLQELVLVVDRNLNIISINEAAEKELSVFKSEVTHKPLLDILFLKDKNNVMVSQQYFPVDRIAEEKTTRILKDLWLLTKNRVLPKPVIIQLRPIDNLEGQVDQITIVISDNRETLTENNQKHISTEISRVKHQAMMEDLKQRVDVLNLPELAIRLELLWRMEQDLQNVKEIEDHSIKQSLFLIDLAQLSKKRVISLQNFAKFLGVTLDFSLPNFGLQDIATLIPKGSKISPDQLTSAFFTAPLDIKWTDLLIQKLLDMAILLTSGIKNPLVTLNIEREGTALLVVTITTNYPAFTKQQEPEIFQPQYGSLGSTTNLKLGSGLEGYLARSIASILGLLLSIEPEKSGGNAFTFKISKTAPAKI